MENLKTQKKEGVGKGMSGSWEKILPERERGENRKEGSRPETGRQELHEAHGDLEKRRVPLFQAAAKQKRCHTERCTSVSLKSKSQRDGLSACLPDHRWQV